MRVRWAVWLIVVLAALAAAGGVAVARPAGQGTEENVAFRSGDLTLHGTVTVPGGAAGRRPGIVLVHGSGPEKRANYRAEVQAMARVGFVVLSYDKRTTGYSQTQRSYARLADDALAGVRLLSRRADVDPHNVGLWGFSEGGWVAPLAASRSTQVSYVVLVGASGVAPARQSAWSLKNELRHEGVGDHRCGACRSPGRGFSRMPVCSPRRITTRCRRCGGYANPCSPCGETTSSHLLRKAPAPSRRRCATAATPM
ncbi:hypothetical protein GCM10010341_53290 [Streptomyces noursei]|nr:hypothetical protein GCM10010341_53290 [Streptomyces noursei]